MKISEIVARAIVKASTVGRSADEYGEVLDMDESVGERVRNLLLD